ncbi:WD repeat-containing protein 34 [Lingula anatina]|uniref:WD repeat-containing protein 34 n=1 Tax=Lingula anatina TaxID=7574 RepID=A0A1S3JBW9_LINAN|nr:WD repeat-containing protein 34 [Lingula anatina]|eukprot:XP_013407902.1 WD repeat-containing protein 34 [Lingula anatina]
MFSDETLECVEFKTSWKKERSVTDSYAQTREILTDELGIQSRETVDTEIQTEEEQDKELHLLNDNPESLGSFLNSVYPIMSKELEKNSRSHAFDGYDVSWEEKAVAVDCIHTLSHSALNEELQVTGLSWNSTGSVLAAAFGKFDHEDWCTHKSALCSWNLDRRNINSTKPDISVDLPSCLMCIAFHPKQPSWIAGGTFTGEVMLWDTSKEDEMLIASSGIGGDAHREPVSKLRWIPDPESRGKKFNIVSISSDGKILVWQIFPHQQALRLIDGFVLLTESLPRNFRPKGQRGDQEVGVTCISFSYEDPMTFVIGSESGCIFKCSTNAKGTPAGRHITSSVPLNSPVTFAFNPHHGPVYDVQCSPFHRNLFMSCGSDTSARLYSMLQGHPITIMEPSAGYLFSSKWSPVRPMVFAVATEDGYLLIYDLKHSHVTPVQKLEAKEPLYALEFNVHKRHLLATGGGRGTIQVWHLSDDLASQGSREVEMLAEIAETSDDQ